MRCAPKLGHGLQVTSVEAWQFGWTGTKTGIALLLPQVIRLPKPKPEQWPKQAVGGKQDCSDSESSEGAASVGEGTNVEPVKQAGAYMSDSHRTGVKCNNEISRFCPLHILSPCWANCTVIRYHSSFLSGFLGASLH